MISQFIKIIFYLVFYIANMVMNLAACTREIFESSEVDEKRQLLNFEFQNLKLDDKNLSIDTCERRVQKDGGGWTGSELFPGKIYQFQIL